MDRLEVMEDKLHALLQEIKELKESKELKEKGEIKWKPKSAQAFWYRNAFGKPESYFWNEHLDQENCENLYKYNILFETAIECQQYCNYMNALTEKSYNFSKIQWENGEINKFYCSYNTKNEDWAIFSTYYFKNEKHYFATEEDAKYMIDNYSEEMLKWG